MNDEYPPPWIALPDLLPTDSTNQGMAETYIKLNWLPFWQSLSAEAKATYLDRWQASPEWRSAIAEAYDLDVEDMEEDARESEAYLARWRQANPDEAVHRPWWRRRR